MQAQLSELQQKYHLEQQARVEVDQAMARMKLEMEDELRRIQAVSEEVSTFHGSVAHLAGSSKESQTN